MILRSLALVVLVAAPAFAAPVPKELKQKPDVERLKGVWAVENVGTRWYFANEKQMFAGGTNTTDQLGNEYGIAVRPGVGFGEMDLSMNGALSHSCIYKFVGDDLHIAYYAGAKRPSDFEIVNGSGKNVHVLKRLPETGK